MERAHGGDCSPLTTPDHRKSAYGKAMALDARVVLGTATPARLSPGTVEDADRDVRSQSLLFPTIGKSLAGAFGRSYYSDQLNLVNMDRGKIFGASLSLRAIAARARAKRASAVRNRLHFSHLAPCDVPGAPLPVAPTHGRSGAAGVAVRGRSLCLTPARCGVHGVAIRALSLASSLPRPVGRAIRLARQLDDANGSGVPVASATAVQPRCNWQALVFHTQFLPVAELRALLTRDAHVCVCARTHVHMCACDAATLQPSIFILTYQYVVGCSSVAAQLQLQLAPCGGSIGRSGARAGNILAGGYRTALHRGSIDARQVLPSSVMRGRGGETFGVFGLAAGRAIGGAAAIVRAGRNGGFLRVSGAASGRVGMVMLEGMAQCLGNAGQIGLRRKPVRLNGETPLGGLSRARVGGRPQARAHIPSPLAHHVNRIWIGVSRRSILPTHAQGAAGAGSWVPTGGPGCGHRAMVGSATRAGVRVCAHGRVAPSVMNREGGHVNAA